MNLVFDLTTKITTDIYYEEVELMRITNSNDIEYQKKIRLIQKKLKNISQLKLELELVTHYFKPEQT